MEDFIRQSKARNIMLVTECSMGDNLRSQFPDRHFVSTCQTCPHMKKITLVKVRDALRDEKFAVEVPEDIRLRALASVQRMLEVS